MKKLIPYLPSSVLVIVSLITHFIYFGRPQAVVFDEVYTGNFLNNYWQGRYFFDVHPPLGKLLIVWFSDILSFTHTAVTHTVDWSAIGNPVPHWVILARILPMLAGALLPLVVYGLCRQIKLSVFASFLAGMLVCFENSLIVQSRFLMTDSMLILFGFLSLLLYLLYRNYDASEDTRLVWKRRVFLFLSALCAAAAGSIKWTGLSFMTVIFILEIMRALSGTSRGIFRKSWSLQKGKKLIYRVRREIFRIFFYGGIFLVVYLTVFAIHFSYLTASGQGDAFMTPRFDKTLTGSAYAGDPSIQPKGFFGKVIELNLTMYSADITMTKPHQYSSTWYTWPLMIRPIFFWQGPQNTQSVSPPSYIYLLGNPLIYWSGTLAMLVTLMTFGYAVFFRKNMKDSALTFIVVGYLVNFVPFMCISRVMFLYHYEAALVFSILAVAFLFDRIFDRDIVSKTVTPKTKIIVGMAFLVTCFLSFIFFSPLTYGLPISPHDLSMRMWLHSWR